jgi:hypothetical protein
MNRNSLYACLTALLCVSTMYSCKKEVTSQDKPSAVPTELASKVAALGFDTNNIVPFGKGYIVENDIFITAEELKFGIHEGTAIRVAKDEQYRTTNLVTGLPRVLTVRCDALPANIVTATDEAITRWNNIRLGLTFTRVTSGTADIVIRSTTISGGTIAFTGNSLNDVFSGFPSATGNPSPFINLNTAYINSATYIPWAATIIQHEMGHTVGMRHTDYMNRAFSCGSGGAEVDPGVGTVYIPGTPTGPEANSFMLACAPGSNTSRSFQPNDVLALSQLYNASHVPAAQPIYEFYSPSRKDRIVTVNANHQLVYSGWNYIGFSFRAFMTTQPGTIGMYEYYNDAVGDHTYSPNPNDPNILSFPNWHLSGGPVFYVYSTNVAGTIPVYRYYNISESSTLFTSNPRIHLDYAGWTQEGIAFYALPS